jgi:hypothetical protein
LIGLPLSCGHQEYYENLSVPQLVRGKTFQPISWFNRLTHVGNNIFPPPHVSAMLVMYFCCPCKEHREQKFRPIVISARLGQSKFILTFGMTAKKLFTTEAGDVRMNIIATLRWLVVWDKIKKSTEL